MIPGHYSVMAQQNKRPVWPQPGKTVHFYVPYGEGGPTSVISRLIGQQLAYDWQFPVEFHHNPVARQRTSFIRAFLQKPADGHHLLIGNLGTHGVDATLNGHALGYSPTGDFQPIAMLGRTPMYLVSRVDFLYDSLAELLRSGDNWREERYITMAHAGRGSTSYIAGLFFREVTKLNIKFIPYPSSRGALEDVTLGYVDMMIDQSISVVPRIQGHQVKPLAYMFRDTHTTGLQIPSVMDSDIGLPELQMTGWNMLLAPRRTDIAIISAISTIVRLALQEARVKQALKEKNTLTLPDIENQPVKLLKFMIAEQDKWENLVKMISPIIEQDGLKLD